MGTTSPLFRLTTKIISYTAIAAILFSTNVALGTTTQLVMTGQQYFADGTGIAYFNDGTTEQFNHTLTEDAGYYYNESTPFYIDEVPGIGNNNGGVICADDIDELAAATNSSRTRSSSSSNDDNIPLGSGNITTITIIRGASLLSDKSRALDPTPIVHIKANDIITWLNQDTTSHWIKSPPTSFGGDLPSGTFINTIISPDGGTLSCMFTEPSGYHYTLDRDIKGAVTVEGEENNPSTPAGQVQQQPQL